MHCPDVEIGWPVRILSPKKIGEYFLDVEVVGLVVLIFHKVYGIRKMV
jgi:hypothetical protein